MAVKRMFHNSVVNSEDFYRLSNDAKLAYFYLGMAADDEGFIATVSRELFPHNISMEAIDELVDAGYLIRFDSPKVYAITDWFVNNNMRKDRFVKTLFTDAKSRLALDENKRYVLQDSIQQVVATDKIRVDKSRIEDINIFCSEPGKPPDSKPQKEITFADVPKLICNDGSEWLPTQEQYDAYLELYQAVDVRREFLRMRQWCISNPKKRKTKNGCSRFVTSWLEKEQNRYHPNGNARRPQREAISYTRQEPVADEQQQSVEEAEDYFRNFFKRQEEG